MRYARKENGQRLFQVDEFLTAQQIQGYFSRTAAKLKHATSQSAHVTDDNDLLAAQEEEAFTSARASILDQCQLVHPIVYDTLNMICSLYTSNKLTKLSVAQLRSICDFYNMDIEAQSSKRKAPYISFISDIVGSCSCTRDALATCRQTIPLWLRYVDDTFTTVHKDEIDDFHKHLNEQNADIQFTREIEENGKLPFLDCLVSRDINKIRTTVYRKPTHTDRLLDETSYNPTSHKATTIKTLTRRAQLVCDTPDSLSDENKYLDRVFHKNNYNTDFIRRNTHRTTETDRNLTSVTTATLPYIKGTSETIARILQPYNIRVAHKPITTLRHLLTNVKDRDEPNNRQGAIYKIKCSDCQASYIGETGRNLTTRLTEHKRATRNGDVNNHISEHHRLTKHKIDWDSAECLTYSTNYFQRLTLESWYTNLEQKPINRCQQLPAPYKRLIHDEKRSDKRTANRTT
ncbi:hypothetical protein ACROYT_G021478 [Oculina patagonica]